ncbi:hypothetical protein P7L70_26690 [Tistrella mobilis]|uniref:acyl-CoA dehydrogenase n=1 Tax=Tistrella mobilis TaxID=171437 RepID=UPI0035573AFD
MTADMATDPLSHTLLPHVPLSRALAAIEAGAAAADREGWDLGPEIGRLREVGVFTACLPPAEGGLGLGLGRDPQATRTAFDLLLRLGRTSLPVARLVEGHIDAVKLVTLHGSRAQIAEMAAGVRAGGLLGVWGADDQPPLTAEWSAAADAPHRLSFTGAKRFASGLGLVTQAVVTFRLGQETATRLALLPVADRRRHRRQDWRAAGMRATASGRHDFTGLEAGPGALLGGPGDYQRPPHFDGGIWRYCAAHLGGAQVLIEAWRRRLDARRRLDDPFQLARLARAVGLVQAAVSRLEVVALAVEAAGADTSASATRIDAAVTDTLLARQLVEDVCVEVLRLSEAALGTDAHMTDQPVERLRRDLSLFIRQAAPDARLVTAGRALAGRAAREGGLW